MRPILLFVIRTPLVFCQLERLIRHQLIFRRLSRRQHLLQQPVRISAEHPRSMEIQPYGHRPRHWRMGQHTRRILWFVGILNSKGIKHWLDDGKWRGHDWNYWRDMLPYYLSVVIAARLSSRAKSGIPRCSGCFAAFLDYASLRSE